MAIYHFSGTIITRSQGRSAVACAAYRSGEELYDDRYDKTHDYTKKQDVVFTEILLLDHAPLWMKDREKLWNFVEKSEKRKDTQLSREFNFALPRELTLAQNIELAKAFVSKGMVVDLCIHDGKMKNGERQPHAHIMLTMREVTPDGFGQKVREWNQKENLLLWREAWADIANKHLFLHEHDIKIDHRTLEAQGIDLEPQYKIGSAIASERMARLADYQRIARENGEKLLDNPKIALTAITRQQSTFTRQDLARFVNRHTVDAEQFQAVYDKVMASRELVSLAQDQKGQGRFTTKEMLAIETKMLEHAKNLHENHYHTVNEKTQERFAEKRKLSDEQKIAFSHLVSAGDLKNVIGFAGTGKSYLLGAAREAWEDQGYAVHGVTLSGIAAESLEAGSGISSRTIASRTYY
jgi:Ti-type conjugative transfer relaxase TraA